jgi:hypothetical protein
MPPIGPHQDLVDAVVAEDCLIFNFSNHLARPLVATVLDEPTRRWQHRWDSLLRGSRWKLWTLKPGRRPTHRPEQVLRRQDSNLDYRNQNPRCCLYTTAEERAQAHLHMVARPLGEVCAASHTGLGDTRGTRH